MNMEPYKLAYQVSKLVHCQSEAVGVCILVVKVNVLLVGLREGERATSTRR